jgi:hypothetical protein
MARTARKSGESEKRSVGLENPGNFDRGSEEILGEISAEDSGVIEIETEEESWQLVVIEKERVEEQADRERRPHECEKIVTTSSS